MCEDINMGKNKSQQCTTCQKTVEVRRMQTHMAKHARAQARKEEEAKKEAAKIAKKQAVLEEAKKQKQKNAEAKQQAFAQKSLSLSKAIWYICGHYDPAHLYHVIFKDTFRTPEDKLYFQEHWDVVENIQCLCEGKNVMEGKLHTHMLAMYKHPEAIATFRKKLTGKMIGNQAAKFKPILPKNPRYNFSIKIQTYSHLMKTILYIQTKDGIHKKFNHQFPETLKGEIEKNLFLFNSLKDWKWSQVNHMKYTEEKIASESSKLRGTEDGRMKRGIENRIDKLQRRLRQLQDRWGPHQSYTVADLETSLDEWLGLCKMVSLKVKVMDRKDSKDCSCVSD